MKQRGRIEIENAEKKGVEKREDKDKTKTGVKERWEREGG